MLIGYRWFQLIMKKKKIDKIFNVEKKKEKKKT